MLNVPEFSKGPAPYAPIKCSPRTIWKKSLISIIALHISCAKKIRQNVTTKKSNFAVNMRMHIYK